MKNNKNKSYLLTKPNFFFLLNHFVQYCNLLCVTFILFLNIYFQVGRTAGYWKYPATVKYPANKPEAVC